MPQVMWPTLAETPYYASFKSFKRLIFKFDLYILVIFQVSHLSTHRWHTYEHKSG